MVSHAQVMNMLRRNVDYNDMVGSTNGAGAGYIGGYIGGCAACRGAGCMGCAMGNGYLGGFRGERKLLKECGYPVNPVTGRPIKSKASRQARADCIDAILKSDRVSKKHNDQYYERMEANEARGALRHAFLAAHPGQRRVTKAEYAEVYGHERPVRRVAAERCGGPARRGYNYCIWRSDYINAHRNAAGKGPSAAQVSAAWRKHKKPNTQAEERALTRLGRLF